MNLPERLASFLGVFTASEGKSLPPLSPVTDRGGWINIVRESFAGAWQSNIKIDFNVVLANAAIFACQTLIASDIAKLRVKLVQRDENGIWSETRNPAYSPVLRKPNDYQTRVQFLEAWITSKLQRGNTYVLKVRDSRQVVTSLYVLDPQLVIPLIATDGSVFYDLRRDRLSGIEEQIIVPAREIIHDRFNCFFHPLVGLSPIWANGLAATQGLAIQNQATRFFANGARPGGILTAPGSISDDTATRLKAAWEEKFSGENAGKVAVVGDGLKYESMSIPANDSQLIEQLKWSAEIIAATYHVPPYKIGAGTVPTHVSVQSLNLEYYAQCLQILIEAIEACLDDGLGMSDGIGTEFDVDNLLRMDSAAQITSLKEATLGGIMAPDEARAKLDLKPTPGGASPYLQQQNYSLEALAKRDAKTDPFAVAGGGSSASAGPPASANDNAAAAAQREALATIRRGLAG